MPRTIVGDNLKEDCFRGLIEELLDDPVLNKYKGILTLQLISNLPCVRHPRSKEEGFAKGMRKMKDSGSTENSFSPLQRLRIIKTYEHFRNKLKQ